MTLASSADNFAPGWVWAQTLESIPSGLSWQPVSVLAGLLGMCVLLISVGLRAVITGKLVPKASVDLATAGYKAVITGQDQRIAFQETALANTIKANNELVSQNRELLVTGRLQAAFMEAVHPHQASGGQHDHLATP